MTTRNQMKRNIIQLRTCNPNIETMTFEEILTTRTCGDWVVGKGRLGYLTHIRISNWNKTKYIKATIRKIELLPNGKYKFEFDNEEVINEPLTFNGQCSRTYHFE